MKKIEKLREEGVHAISDDGIYMEDLIMESILRRPLADNETVFHENKNTLDNRRSNLYVVEFARVQ